MEVESVFISGGCNRVAGAASWGPNGLIAFALHNSVAIFCPQRGQIIRTLRGHTNFVNCVEWLPRHHIVSRDGSTMEEQYLLSGSAGGQIILWDCSSKEEKVQHTKFTELSNSHDKSVTCINGLMLTSFEAIIASSSSDCTVRLWNATFSSEGCKISFLQSISVGSKAVVTLSLAMLPDNSGNMILAMGSLNNQINLLVGQKNGQFRAACVLKGHQDWVRSLDFSFPFEDNSSQALYLASSAQDKQIRIWKIVSTSHSNDTEVATKSHAFSLKMYIDGPVFRAGSVVWQVCLESLLVGHEDWVHSVKWEPPRLGEESMKRVIQPLSLLSASMDRTMMIWRPDEKMGLWMNQVTVGELSHSALGFYGGLWGPHGNAILAHGFSGSFHLWRNVGEKTANWQPKLVPSGHYAAVVDIAWAKTGQFLLSASHDQTIRLFAPWKRNKTNSIETAITWHEIARPQVHGHDFNCLAVLKGKGNHRYVSGAEEKVARVFEAPITFLETLLNTADGAAFHLTEMQKDSVKALGANMSALGLSQKPILSQGVSNKSSDSGMESIPDAIPIALSEPPLEEHLLWNTLWPESHKLYGHGNELFAMCSDHSGQLLATACKAQSANVAEIWVWEQASWKAVARLESHSLTVTQMEFSGNDRYLLSVSRDRHFSLFKLRNTEDTSHQGNLYELVTRLEAHKRIIWTCSWSPCNTMFVTGSRDKAVKIWGIQEGGGITISQKACLPLFKSSVNAVAWAPIFHRNKYNYLLAIGMEDGLIELWNLTVSNMTPTSPIEVHCLLKFDPFLCHVASVNRLSWKPTIQQEDYEKERVDLDLASCGSDHTVRLFHVKLG